MTEPDIGNFRHVYTDAGNQFVADLVVGGTKRILDVGCGSGDTARMIKSRIPSVRIEGITFNHDEASVAAEVLDRVHVMDLENIDHSAFTGQFDCLLFSHVLEHMRTPPDVISSLERYLIASGTMIIAVPNVLEWRTRMKFLRGEWTYADSGILDRTHVTFVTYYSAENVLLGSLLKSGLELEAKLGQGSVPLGPLRKMIGLRHVQSRFDRWGNRYCPNLFAWQIVLVVRKIEVEKAAHTS